MRLDEQLLKILAVDCRLDGFADEGVLTPVATVRETLAALRAGHFDLLLTRAVCADEPIWPLVERVRRVRSKLPWVLVARGIATHDEVLARQLGVTRIVGFAPTADALAALLARPAARLPTYRTADAVPIVPAPA